MAKALNGIFPFLEVYNTTYAWLINAKYNSETFLSKIPRCVHTTNFMNIFLGKFCIPFMFSVRDSSFFGAISHIIFISSFKKMRWIYARRNIASVANMHSAENTSKVQKVTDSMSREFSFVNTDYSVSTRIFASAPQPTFGWSFPFAYFFPKASLDFCRDLWYNTYSLIHSTRMGLVRAFWLFVQPLRPSLY